MRPRDCDRVAQLGLGSTNDDGQVSPRSHWTNGGYGEGRAKSVPIPPLSILTVNLTPDSQMRRSRKRGPWKVFCPAVLAREERECNKDNRGLARPHLAASGTEQGTAQKWENTAHAAPRTTTMARRRGSKSGFAEIQRKKGKKTRCCFSRGFYDNANCPLCSALLYRPFICTLRRASDGFKMELSMWYNERVGE